jgi:hypothetical protein
MRLLELKLITLNHHEMDHFLPVSVDLCVVSDKQKFLPSQCGLSRKAHGV